MIDIQIADSVLKSKIENHKYISLTIPFDHSK